MEVLMENIPNDQKEIRLKDERGHFLGKILNRIVYVYCKRCKKFHEVMQRGGEEDTLIN